MQIPDYYIQEFKKEFKKEFGEELSDKDAYDKLLSVVNVLRIFREYIPITKESIDAMPDEKSMEKPSSVPQKRARKKAGQ